MPVAEMAASPSAVADGGSPFDLSQADWAVSTVMLNPFPTSEERVKIAAFVERVRAGAESSPSEFGVRTLAESGIVCFWTRAAHWFDHPHSHFIIGEFTAALLWRAIGRPGEPDFTVGTRPPLCPREWVGTQRTPARTPSRAVVVSAWRAVKDRTRELGVQVSAPDPVDISTEQLVEDIHAMTRAIAYAAGLKGEASWPSPTA